MDIMKMMMISSIMFMCMKHPLSMGLMLIIQTITIAMITGEMIDSFWYSYILVISMVSGMLVLFIYMSSIASNEKFSTSIKMLMILLIMMILSIMLTSNKMKMNFMESSMVNKYLEFEQMLNMSKLMNKQIMYITIMMVMYLLFTMIVVSHNTNILEGPMRKKS